MSSHLISLIAFLLVFLLATLRPINMGLLAFAAALVVNAVVEAGPVKNVLAGFPGDLFVTLVGVTFLFAVAQRNGGVEWLVIWLSRLVGHRAIMMPLVVFVLAGSLTAFGALSPAAVAVVAPLALRFSDRYRISPLMMGLMVLHGAQAGAFSPISIFGGITNAVVGKAGLTPEPMALFFASLAFNASIATIAFIVFGGTRLTGTTCDQPAPQANQSVDGCMARERTLTLVTLAATAIATIVLRVDIGVAAVCAASVLAFIAPRSQKGAVENVAWSTILLICGVVTYVSLMQELGTVDVASNAIAKIHTPLIASLLLCYLAGIVSAFASSTALLGVLIPLALPFGEQNSVSATGMIIAIAVSTTIVDTSPFSTNGALVVANADATKRDVFFRRLLVYTAAVTLMGPAAVWGILVAMS